MVSQPRPSLWNGWRTALENREFLWLVGVFFIVQAANSLCAGLLVLFTAHVIQAPELIGMFFLAMFGSTALCLPVWVFLSRWKSKPFAWLVSIVLCCCGLGLATTLGTGDIVGMYFVSIAMGAAFGSDAIMPTSMLADIVYKGEEAGDQRKAATLLAFKNAVSKMTFVVPMGMAFPVLELVGFDKTGANSQGHLTVLVFFFAVLPILLRVLGGVLLLNIQRRGPSLHPSGHA